MKKNTQIFSLGGFVAYLAFALPSLALAQQIGDAGELVQFIIDFINGTLVPLIFALAFIVFIWGIFTTFILGGSDPEKQKEGKQLILWGLIAFFVMVSVWGLVNILVGTFGFEGSTAPELPEFDRGTTGGSAGGSI